MAAIERGGDVRIQTGKWGNRRTLHKFINAHAPNPKRIMTDERAAYDGIADADTTHETVTHSKKEYVGGDIHTNTVERAFGLFKGRLSGRSIRSA